MSHQCSEYARWHIGDNKLVLENTSFHPMIVTDATPLAGNGSQFLVRAASLRNQAGHSYATTDSLGNKRRVDTTSWGLVFAYTDPDHYLKATISCSNSNLYDDLTDKRQMCIEVWRHQSSAEHLLCSTTIGEGVDLEDGVNTLMVSIENNKALLSIGKTKLQTVAIVNLNECELSCAKAGIILSGGAKIAVERTVLSCDNDAPRRMVTTWTRESLEQHFNNSTDPIEGYWRYQDRDMEDKWLRLGGRYTLAIVSSPDGYDLIYIDGAQVNASRWQEGLLKGHISKTIFDGHYDLEWLDATFVPIVQDAYASFDNGVLMTLNFPVYKSQLRLSKVLLP